MKRRWLRWLSWVAVVLSVAIMGGFLWASAGQLRQLDWRGFLYPVAVGLALYGLSLGLQAVVWTGLVSQMTGRRWGWWDVGVYYATHLTRRLPGAPWYMAGRAMIYQERDRGGEAALAASLLEWGGMLATAGGWVAVGKRGLAGGLGVGLGLALIALAWGRLRRSDRLPGRVRSLAALSARRILLAWVAYSAAWVLGGAILYLLVRAAMPGTPGNLLTFTSTWAISGAISMLALAIPAGLGIREVTLTALLQPSLGTGLSVVVALLIRALFTTGDLVWGGLIGLLVRGLTPAVLLEPRQGDEGEPVIRRQLR